MEPHVETRSKQDRSNASAAELTGDLARELTALVHDEVALARAEIAEKGKTLVFGAGLGGAAGAVGGLGAVCLVGCAVAALSTELAVWLSALLVGAALFVVAGVLALAARSAVKQAAPPIPVETLEHAKEDVAWIKEHARSTRT